MRRRGLIVSPRRFLYYTKFQLKFLQFGLIYAILIMPNNSYNLNGGTGFFYILTFKYNIFYYTHAMNGKNANSIYVSTINRTRMRIVWRQSEFAFFVR